MERVEEKNVKEKEKYRSHRIKEKQSKQQCDVGRPWDEDPEKGSQMEILGDHTIDLQTFIKFIKT